MSNNYFNPATANNLARFQGTLAGIQAGYGYYTGVGTAATSILNQAGYHPYVGDNGYIHLVKDADSSTFTGKWYDSTFGKNFDFSNA